MDFHELIKTFKKSAFRLEGLPRYIIPGEDEAVTHFLSTGELLKDLNHDWIENLKKAQERGAAVERLRLMSDPLTNYEEFEISAFKSNIESGEEIRVMDRDDWPWTGDFWFFDTIWIARLRYDIDGNFLGADVTEANEDDKADLDYWMSLFHSAPRIQDLYKVD